MAEFVFEPYSCYYWIIANEGLVICMPGVDMAEFSFEPYSCYYWIIANEGLVIYMPGVDMAEFSFKLYSCYYWDIDNEGLSSYAQPGARHHWVWVCICVITYWLLSSVKYLLDISNVSSIDFEYSVLLKSFKGGMFNLCWCWLLRNSRVILFSSRSHFSCKKIDYVHLCHKSLRGKI